MDGHVEEGISQFPSGNTPPSVLIVDDEPAFRRSARRSLASDGYELIEAETGARALQVISEKRVSLVLLDVCLRNERGLDILQEVKRVAPDVAVIMITGAPDPRVMTQCLDAGAQAFLAKPCRKTDIRAQVYASLVSRHRQRSERAAWKASLERLTHHVPCQLAERLAMASRLRDSETGAHVERTGRYSATLARALGFSAQQASLVGVAATTHDVGKIAIPDSILLKPGRLSDEEYRLMKRHTVIGAEILSGTDVPALKLAATIARSHHERWDGSGYPEGLKGDACPVEARIVAVADVYDALVHPRVYRTAWPEERAMGLFKEKRGVEFDPRIVDTFFEILPAIRKIRADLPEETEDSK
jgi:putative two-component system response regulator